MKWPRARSTWSVTATPTASFGLRSLSFREQTFFSLPSRIHCSDFSILSVYLCRWFLPFIGHMGIATSSGVIRDFAGPYYVSEDNMAFGNPTRYWQLDPSKAEGNPISSLAFQRRQ